MIIAEKYTVPDKCPDDCDFIHDFRNYGQSAICFRCPVFVCQEPKTEEDKYYMPMVPANEYREDWASEWEKFFNTGEYPKLML